jgi:hypothetical protein
MIQFADSDAGTSLRLGNVIDMWWYQLNFPTHERGMANHTSRLETIGGDYEGHDGISWPDEATCFFKQCPKTEHCFGHWLGSQLKLFDEETALRSAGNVRLTHARDLLDDRYGIYHPHTVKDLMMPELHNDLRKAIETYAKQNPQLLVKPKAEAVVHYRVGDVLDNEPPMHPRSLARALASLSPQPKTIELLNGGFSFGPSPHKGANIKFSVWLLKMLSDEIFKVLPDATVTMPTATSMKGWRLTSTAGGDTSHTPPTHACSDCAKAFLCCRLASRLSPRDSRRRQPTVAAAAHARLARSSWR